MFIAPVPGDCGCDSLSASMEMMSVAEARDLAISLVKPIEETERVSLSEALGRTIGRAVHAPREMPFFDNAAMDGFALRCADLADRCCLPVGATVAAGDAPMRLPEGAAVRIFTGAPVPAGADAVVMVEACIDKQHKVHISQVPAPGTNIRRAGSDQFVGQSLIASGKYVDAHHIGLLAANGIYEIEVVRRPRVAVFSTGDELCAGPCAPGQIPDANRPMLLALARQAGAEVSDLGILPDDPRSTADALGGIGARFDLVLSSGAVSMGGKDHIRGALEAAGGTVQGSRVAIKPGKPVMFGQLGAAGFTGLPGNPFAVHVGFHLFVLPQLLRLLGARQTAFAPVPAVAGFDWTRKAGRAEVFPVRLVGHDTAGCPILGRLGKSVSATLLPLAEADGLAIVPPNTSRITAGTALAWHPFCDKGNPQ
ncbi:molybdopterin biosynthesis protein [Dinoroseobacter shibae DFL 12 = DSM 16493]|jgi:molybdopterin molybdotransferase|uniref:Molybdopterin molybdenumtransferase n=2 Tax=Dinoroseobacter shibae TaxID=215813 RepID=A8LR90_DINSH|nr:molybdopterin biosynthesis protein [Dinoroseobacter shibae DFL 12 = DSM 16493]